VLDNSSTVVSKTAPEASIAPTCGLSTFPLPLLRVSLVVVTFVTTFFVNDSADKFSYTTSHPFYADDYDPNFTNTVGSDNTEV
jgi:hypothetical protein